MPGLWMSEGVIARVAQHVQQLEADVVVAGGGLSGVCAALAAARLGCRVILVQDRPVLGGNSSSEIRMHISGAEALMHGRRDGLDYRETGIIEELKLEEAVANPQRSAHVWDLVLWDAVKREANITLLLNTICDGAVVADDRLPPASDLVTSGTQGVDPVGAVRRIRYVLASRPSTEESFRIAGKYFIDCTGDGRLGFEAGADYRYGREGKSDYDEPLAPVAKGDGKVLGSSITFTARCYDRPMPFTPPSWVRRFTEEDLKYRSHKGLDYGHWWIEWGGQLDTIKDNEEIRDELLAIALGVWDHIKNGGNHGADNWALDWIGFVPGKRESRRFYGDHVLTQHDLQEAPLFADRVAYGGWPIDVHVPEGIDRPDERPNFAVRLNKAYSIPLRCLYSRNVVNMFMAGRNISASHVAFGSTRVMGTCALMGQAAGTAAGIAAIHDLPAARVCLQDPWMRQIQQQLIRDDAYLVEMAADDPLDLARTAAVSASSWTDGGEPAQVINGITRRLPGSENMWISEAGWPQRLSLVWQEPQDISLIELTLDTGLHRELRLSMSEAVAENSIRAPQPETLRDFILRLYEKDRVVATQKISGNYQRKLRIRFDQTVASDRLELEALGAWGVDHARLFEVRVYS
jgi:hypothetical protein